MNDVKNAATPLVDLTGRGIGVTGGSSPLGRAIAHAMARAGATVVICGRTQSKLDDVCSEAKAMGLAGRVVAEVADITCDEDIERVLDRIEREAGEVHGWVNNAHPAQAAVANAQGFGSLERAHFETAAGKAISACAMAMQAAAARMRAGAAIVNIATIYGGVAPQPDAYRHTPAFASPPVYGAAKAGIVQLTRHVAVELAPRGIRVNCVSPGPFPSEAVREAPEFIGELAARIPLGRVGEAHEIGTPVAFLLCDGASFMTGHDLMVDGGWTAW